MTEGAAFRGYRRGDTAFFHRASTHKAVDAIALADDLVIYVGAGATIDAGGPSWRELVAKLAEKSALASKKILSNVDRQTLSEHLSPLEASTALATYYAKLREDPLRARKSLVGRVREHIYPDATWNAGKLNEVLAKFLIFRAVAEILDGPPWRTLVVTTNYDTFLEEELSRQILWMTEPPETADVRALGITVNPITLKTARSSGFRDLAEIASEVGEPGTISIVYLHGRLPEEGGQVEPLAITETDYNYLRPQVSSVLRWAFEGRSALIVGSSLSDPPLVSALQDTYQSGARRLALLPMPAIASQARGEPGESELIALRKHQAARLEQFEVEMLAPDFFSQVAQFVQECIVAIAKIGPSETYATKRDLRYGGRLTAWWDGWYKHRFSNLRFRDFTRTKLHGLAERIVHDELIEAGGIPGYKDEVLKVEMWVRWHPDDDHRCLALWASSDSIWHEEKTLRMADLSLASEYAAVRSYVAGRPQLDYATNDGTAVESEDSPHVDRWKTFLSVPIHLEGEIGVLPVGVITLASRAGEGASAIWATSAPKMEELVANLLVVGLEALSPDRWSDPTDPRRRTSSPRVRKAGTGRGPTAGPRKVRGRPDKDAQSPNPSGAPTRSRTKPPSGV